jgi:hypothetical protein
MFIDRARCHSRLLRKLQLALKHLILTKFNSCMHVPSRATTGNRIESEFVFTCILTAHVMLPNKQQQSHMPTAKDR